MNPIAPYWPLHLNVTKGPGPPKSFDNLLRSTIMLDQLEER